MKKLNDLEAHFLVDHGYLLLDSFLSENQIKKSNDLIQETLQKTGIPESRESAELWVREKTKLQRNKEIVSLIDQVREYLEIKLIGPIRRSSSCQIACRFPGEQCNSDGSIPSDWYDDWHIDNYTEKDFKRRSIPKDFTCLVGIYLTDNLNDFAGNYTIFPGRHYSIQEFSRRNGGEEYYRKNGLEDVRKTLNLADPFQIKAKKGSVVIAHRMLPHLISAPNTTQNIRTIVWFRVTVDRLAENLDPECFTNIWKYWTIPKTTEYPEKFEQDIRMIEFKGLGHLVKMTAGEFVLRLRQNGSQPCMYGSMITLRYYTEKNDFDIHTNGFINRKKHKMMADMIKTYCRESKEFDSNKFDLVKIAEWIDTCDYDKLICTWYPMINNKNDEENVRKTMKFHHLHSKSKSEMMKRWCDELSLNGMIVKGQPGYLILCGNKNNMNLFFDRFDCFHWKKVDEIKNFDIELLSSVTICQLDEIKDKL